MDSRPETTSKTPTVVSNCITGKQCKLIVLHQNVCSLKNKVTELEMLLSTELKHIDILCLTEHWQSDQNISYINISGFRLVSAFCRSSSKHGRSGIHIKDGFVTSEINHFTNICEEKNFEMSLIELPMYKFNIVCIYRSPDGQLHTFLNKLELVIQKLLNKNKILLLCGDWNIDFLREDSDQKDLTDLLLRCNLVNVVKSPTRITSSTKTLLDVIIINKTHYTLPATVIELGLSDHQAQVLPVLNKTRSSANQRVFKRHFRENNIREFKYLLTKETWREVLLDTAFPLEFAHDKKTTK